MSGTTTHSYWTGLDWLVLAAYFVATMAVGLWCQSRSRSVEGFTAAGRSLPGWLTGLSIFATFLSSISFLALPGKAYATNWNPFVFSLSLPLATWVAVRWFLPFYRASGEVSAYAHLEHRFGPWARVYAGTFFLLTQIARAGAVTYLMALPLAVLTGVDVSLLIVVVGVAVTLYSTVGGIVAVIWTDALQAVVLIAGAVVCVLVLLFGVPGGPAEVFAVAGEHDKFSLGSLGPSLAEETFWVVLAYGVFTNLQNFGIDQGYVQRYIAAGSDAEARKSVWLGGLLYVPVSAVFFLIGTALFAWYQTHPEDLAEVRRAVAIQKLARAEEHAEPADDATRVAELERQLTPADVGDKVFPHFIGKRLPPGVTGLIIAAVLAAGMSTVSTSLNSSATLLLSDYYRRYWRPGAGEREAMLVLYAGTVTWGVLGTAVALLLVNVTSALDAWWTLASIFSGGIVGLFLLGLISRRADNFAAVVAVLAGLAVIVWMTLSRTAYWPAELAAWRSPLHNFLVIVAGTLTILGVGLTLSWLSPRTR